uniref:Uncharacterized protein n=1 Tax=Strigamia maritima TaxID=126957 RepID=T1IVU7_STRMM
MQYTELEMIKGQLHPYDRQKLPPEVIPPMTSDDVSKQPNSQTQIIGSALRNSSFVIHNQLDQTIRCTNIMITNPILPTDHWQFDLLKVRQPLITRIRHSLIENSLDSAHKLV